MSRAGSMRRPNFRDRLQPPPSGSGPEAIAARQPAPPIGVLIRRPGQIGLLSLADDVFHREYCECTARLCDEVDCRVHDPVVGAVARRTSRGAACGLERTPKPLAFAV